MDKYEYKAVPVKSPSEARVGENMDDVLNREAKNGYRLIWVLEHPGQSVEYHFILERQAK